MLYNILSNAIKFTPQGGAIQVSAERGQDLGVQIIIQDTGCGIAAEFLPHVFDKFGQEDASITRQHGGLGLGLSIAKQLTELHGGSIAVASPGRGLGTKFTLTFPIISVVAASCWAQHSATPAHSRMLVHRRVLVVDDVEDTRELTRDVLSAHGAQVLTAASGVKALELLRTEVLDVIVSDIGMPEMDGYMFIKEVRRSGLSAAALPAIALTAFASALDRQKALDAGFQAHVAKPHIVGELVSRLAEVLANQNAAAE